MTNYLIAMYNPPGIADEDLADAARDSMALVEEARAAGVWVFGGGVADGTEATMVAVDGVVTDGPFPESKEHIGGFCVLDLPSREVALEWAARVAAACRCPQELQELGADPTLEES